MKFGYTYIVFSLVLSTYFVHNAVAMPRTVLENQDGVSTLHHVQLEKSPAQLSVQSTTIPGRVSCQFEEATEDAICQNLCLPKGYSYGICVSHTCTCV